MTENQDTRHPFVIVDTALLDQFTIDDVSAPTIASYVALLACANEGGAWSDKQIAYRAHVSLEAFRRARTILMKIHLLTVDTDGSFRVIPAADAVKERSR